MPLRCIDQHGATIDASMCGDADWKALRARARAEHHLRMPCCTAAAVLKTSSRGTRFFAHKAKGGCTWKPETEVHRYLKSLALRAAREAGWAAETESSGTTPDGERWTADVLAWRGDEKTAVEIQWSSQTNEETLERQERYQRSGVRGVWLLRRPGFPVSEDLPVACIGGSFEEGLKVLVPKVDKMSRRRQKEDQDNVQVLTTGSVHGRSVRRQVPIRNPSGNAGEYQNYSETEPVRERHQVHRKSVQVGTASHSSGVGRGKSHSEGGTSPN